MQKLDVYTMKKFTGGAVSAGVVAGIWAALSFVVGIFDGFSRPYKCR